MESKTFNTLEYNKIIELLSEQASCDMAKKILRSIKPMTCAAEICDAISETTEAQTVIIKKGMVPLGQIYDISGSLSFARKGGSLNMKQLLQVLYNLKVASNVITFLKSDLPELPIIDSIREVLVTFPRLAENIDRCILSEDEMADNASSELKNIRRSITRQNDAIKNRINNILNSADNRTYLQDSIVTIRDGRYVIPVKAEHRGRFQGIIHDQSSTGATLFIEPQVIVNMNNELRELELAEKVEVERILLELSSAVAEHFHEIMNNQKLLIDLDVIFAKGKLSMLMGGEAPEIAEDGLLNLKSARHPLIDKKKVIPIDVKLGDDYKTLVVTGPNTGGKTVTLKTVGLLVLMAQSGLHIPAAMTSRIPVFERVFADIGDEQSIEQSLSTFSSHMKNIVYILGEVNNSSLVLLDELGAGTDPTEGAALAISILENLKNWGACTIATTHYNELKKYALSTDGVENGSMEFNINTLSPTYRLMTGIPGKSNAFEISRKLGLSEELINRASELLERKDIEFEDVIQSIEKDKKRAEEERDEAIMLNISMKKQKEELEKQAARIKEQERDIIQKAKEEARSILKEAKDTAGDVSKELRRLSKIDSLGERNRRFDETKKRLKEAEDKFAERMVRRVNQSPVNVDKLKVGDKVRVLTLDQAGEILSLPDSKGDLVVKIGIMKVNINVDDLMFLENDTKKEDKEKGRYGSLYKSKAQSISVSVNVQGENLDDAVMDVDKYLDDAFMAGLKEVTVIHGRGEGILKEGLRKLFRRHKHVASYRKGGYNEGGDGVTIVTLKE
ncbi:MAG: endonuclease MutS2 [Firmicutes bacterium]|jgi:DNA mismatch repair protein MutS2|nr:endonuclease MutS2 [Bacillota bacterium]